MDKLSYALGMSIAHNLSQSGVESLDFESFTSAIRDMMSGKQPQLSFDEAGKILDKYFTEVEAKMKEEQSAMAAAFKEEGENWLKANAAKEGVKTLASGLQYKVIKEGNGKKPGPKDQVRCHYEGTLVNGMKFDSSYDRNEPAVFGVNQVIAGWTEALQLMTEGSVWELYIPYQLAYGEQGAQGAIPPCAALIFKVELLEVL